MVAEVATPWVVPTAVPAVSESHFYQEPVNLEHSEPFLTSSMSVSISIRVLKIAMSLLCSLEMGVLKQALTPPKVAPQLARPPKQECAA